MKARLRQCTPILGKKWILKVLGTRDGIEHQATLGFGAEDMFTMYIEDGSLRAAVLMWRPETP